MPVHESMWVEETASDGVVDAIANLKAYCVAAKAIDIKGFSGSLKNSAYALVDAFGTMSKKTDIVTDYAQTMGKLRVKWTEGIGSYMLDEINHSTLSGRNV